MKNRIVNLILYISIIIGINITNAYSQTVIQNTTITSPPTGPTAITSATGQVIFIADKAIILLPGFSVLNGSNFHAFIQTVPLEYASLSSDLDASFYITNNNVLNFLYEEKYVDGSLNYKIYDYKRSLTTLIPLPVINKVVGASYLSLDIKQLCKAPIRADQADAFYILEVTNSKGEISMLRFKYIPLSN